MYELHFLQKTGIYSKGMYTAPVFRSKPGIDVGFLRGGFWKYNVKPLNILLVSDDVDDNPEGKHTIRDDLVVAEQDFVAGLVRMGILFSIRYHLEVSAETDISANVLFKSALTNIMHCTRYS